MGSNKRKVRDESEEESSSPSVSSEEVVDGKAAVKRKRLAQHIRDYASKRESVPEEWTVPHLITYYGEVKGDCAKKRVDRNRINGRVVFLGPRPISETLYLQIQINKGEKGYIGLREDDSGCVPDESVTVEVKAIPSTDEGKYVYFTTVPIRFNGSGKIWGRCNHQMILLSSPDDSEEDAIVSWFSGLTYITDMPHDVLTREWLSRVSFLYDKFLEALELPLL